METTRRCVVRVSGTLRILVGCAPGDADGGASAILSSDHPSARVVAVQKLPIAPHRLTCTERDITVNARAFSIYAVSASKTVLMPTMSFVSDDTMQRPKHRSPTYWIPVRMARTRRACRSCFVEGTAPVPACQPSSNGICGHRDPHVHCNCTPAFTSLVQPSVASD